MIRTLRPALIAFGAAGFAVLAFGVGRRCERAWRIRVMFKRDLRLGVRPAVIRTARATCVDPLRLVEAARKSATEDVVLSRAEFSRLVGVTPDRVAWWITEGTISADALATKDQEVRIRMARAVADLKSSLRLRPAVTTPASASINR